MCKTHVLSKASSIGRKPPGNHASGPGAVSVFISFTIPANYSSEKVRAMCRFSPERQSIGFSIVLRNRNTTEARCVRTQQLHVERIYVLLDQALIRNGPRSVKREDIKHFLLRSLATVWK
jgi:hypothetical protein